MGLLLRVRCLPLSRFVSFGFEGNCLFKRLAGRTDRQDLIGNFYPPRPDCQRYKEEGIGEGFLPISETDDGLFDFLDPSEYVA